MNVAGLRNLLSFLIVTTGLAAGMSSSAAWAQMLEPGTQSQAPNPLTDATMKPGKMLLFDLEARFAKDVLERAERDLPPGLPTTAWRWATARRR